MKKLGLCIVLGITPVLLMAQTAEQKEKKVALDETTEVVYHLAANGLKNGPVLIKDTKTNAIYLKGAHTNDAPSGKWYFYNEKGQLESYYNFDQKKLLYIDSAYLKKINIVINSRDKNAVQEASIPIPLYPSSLFLKLIAKNIDIPNEHFDNQKELPITVKATINTNGQATYAAMYRYNNIVIEKPIRLNDMVMKILWIPAKYKDNPVQSIFAMDTKLDGGDHKMGHRRFTWNY